MKFEIYQENEQDYDQIYNLVKIAFQTSEDADGDEHDYVNNLRLSPNYIPELAFIIKDDAAIIGHIMLTKTYISRGHEKMEALLLSPLCVQFEYRNRGVGSQLIRYSLDVARFKGYKAVFIVGQPEYYSRFGFTSIADFGVIDTGDIPVQYTMVVELEKGFLAGQGGVVTIY